MIVYLVLGVGYVLVNTFIIYDICKEDGSRENV